MLIAFTPAKSVILLCDTNHTKKIIWKQKLIDFCFQQQKMWFVKQYTIRKKRVVEWLQWRNQRGKDSPNSNEIRNPNKGKPYSWLMS